MQRKTIMVLGAVAAAAVLGAAAMAGPGSDRGHGPMQGMMHGQAGPAQMMQWHGAPGTMQRHGGFGMMMDGRGQPGGHGPGRMQAMAEHPLFQGFDEDGDGTVSMEEAATGADALHEAHDADGDGVLSPDEFQSLFAEVARGFADGPFARLDVDGDGRVSPEELSFPAQMMARMLLMQVNDRDASGE